MDSSSGGTQEVSEGSKYKTNLIWVGVLFGVIYWVLESVRDVLAFQKGTLTERLFYPDLPSVWTRLIIVAMILFYGFYAQSLRSLGRRGNEAAGSPVRIIGSGFIFAFAYWILESARDAFVFRQGSWVDQLVRPDVPDVSVRLLAVSVLVLFSVYVQNLMNQRKAAEESLRRTREQLERMVEERTGELARTNESLKAEVEGRKRLETALWVSRKCFQDIVNATSDGILILDKQRRIRFSNVSAARLLERPSQELLGQEFQLSVQAGQVRQIELPKGESEIAVEMKVLETEWQGEWAFLVLLHPDHQSLYQLIFSR